jgi:hypothetical protein
MVSRSAKSARGNQIRDTGGARLRAAVKGVIASKHEPKHAGALQPQATTAPQSGELAQRMTGLGVGNVAP